MNHAYERPAHEPACELLRSLTDGAIWQCGYHLDGKKLSGPPECISPGGDVQIIRVKLLRAGAQLPYRATEAASGYDIYASLPDGPVRLGPLPTLIPTGIALEVPPGLDAQLRPRSGLAAKGVLATFGTLDADYRGELKINLYTMATAIEHNVNDGDRIAQLVVVRLADVAFEEAGSLSDTERGAGGHGSTGR